MALSELYQTLNHADPKPMYLEVLVVGCSLFIFLLYFIHVIRTGNSKILSFSTLFVAAGTAIILISKELINKRRWLIVIQYIILISIIGYLTFHRWEIYRTRIEDK